VVAIAPTRARDLVTGQVLSIRDGGMEPGPEAVPETGGKPHWLGSDKYKDQVSPGGRGGGGGGHARLTRLAGWACSRVVLHTDGATLVFNGYTHEEFVETVPPDRPGHGAIEWVILEGRRARLSSIASIPRGLRFLSSPRGYDKILSRRAKRSLSNLLDLFPWDGDSPRLNGADGRSTPSMCFLPDDRLATAGNGVPRDKPHFAFTGIVPGDRHSPHSGPKVSRIDPRPTIRASLPQDPSRGRRRRKARG